LAAFAVVISAVVALVGAEASSAATLPSGFTETTVFTGLNAPVNFRFAADGRVFVAQKGGVIKEYDNLTDTTPTTVIDLSTDTIDFWDRGLLGMALDPNFPASPYLYVLEAYDAPIGGTAPRWGDNCPTPPGPTTDGCVVSGRLLKLTLTGNTATNTTVLIKDQWCQQFPSHSIGDLNFGADGALYVSGGDGASYNFADYGQSGGSGGSPTPKNPCGDPPAGVGGTMTPPTAEGGALRAQSLRRASGEPVLLNGAVLRVDPATGNALPTNPLAGNADPNARRIVAYGFRNPFRFTIRPLTSDLWIGDVGWNDWEEIDRQPNPTSGALNFGWPCYEGVNPQPGYQSAGLNLCSSLYSAGIATPPYFTYNHAAHITAGDSCPTGSSAITGLAFYTGASNYPASYNNGLFFADYARNCISFMPVGTNGLPDPTRVQPFASSAAGPVDLEIGPNGDLFYADLNSGTIREIKYAGGGNTPPTAVATASPTAGTAPLTVNFDGSASSDPNAGDTLTYSWDLNGDGTFGDSTAAKPTYTYASNGTYNAVLKVTDNHGASTTSSPVTITVSSSGTSTFGTTTPGTLIDTAGADLKEVSKFTSPSAGSVVKLTGYVSGLGAGTGTQKVRAVLYADSGGNPGNLLGVSNEVSISAGRPWGWVDFTFPSTVAIQSGTVWIGYIAGSPSDLTQLMYTSVTNDLRFNANAGGYAAGASNPFGSSIPYDFHYSIYATYIPSGGGTNHPPTAVATGTPTSGTAPLTVNFNGSASADPDVGDTISYSWDLNGDGTFGDSTVANPSFTYAAAGTYNAKLKVTDNHGASTTSAPVTITVSAAGNQPPVPTITSPLSTLTWKVGDRIDFSGSASDPQDGSLPASNLTWNLIIHHCDPTGQTCHIHPVQTFTGVSSGFFNAPDHGYPSYLELQLTATDSLGLTATTSVNLQPQVVNVNFTSTPTGLQLVFDGSSVATPFSFQAIMGSAHSISAPATQTLGGTTYTFSSWSDQGAATHNVTTATDTTFAATYSGGGGTNQPPTALATGSPTSGTAPLTVNFDGSASADPDVGDTISYSWDLNGDGTFGDSTVAKPSFTYAAAGTYNAKLKVTDNHGASTTSSSVTITVSSGGGTGTFGTTTPGTLVDYATLNYKEVSKYTAPSAGNVVKVTGYLSGLGATSSSEKIKAIIYADNAGQPGARLGVSNEVTINAKQAWGWVNFTFGSPVAIQAGTVWIGYIAGGSKSDLIQMRYNQVAADLRFNPDPYSSGPAATFGATMTADLHYSLYATYG
jgi:PKD repeat protein